MLVRWIIILSGIVFLLQCQASSIKYSKNESMDNATPSQEQQKFLVSLFWEQVDLGGGEGQHVYIKLNQAREYEYEDRVVVGSSPPYKVEYVKKKGVISSDTYNSIQALLGSIFSISLQEEYVSSVRSIDSFTKLDIFLNLHGDSKKTKLINFNLADSSSRQIYPKDLVKLLCAIERIRSSASYSITPSLRKDCRIN